MTESQNHRTPFFGKDPHRLLSPMAGSTLDVPKSNHMSGSTVQMLLELQKLGTMITAPGSQFLANGL